MGIQTTYNGTVYYVNMLAPAANSGDPVTLYFSQVDDSCTDGDMAIQLTPSVGTYSQAAFQTGCQIYQAYDTVKKVAGCFSVASSILCALSVLPTDGATVFFCEAVWKYTADTGAAECIGVVGDKIAEAIDQSMAWDGFKVATGGPDGDFKGFIENIIGLFCDPNVNPALKQP